MAAPFSAYADYDGLGLAALVARGEVHPRELVEACIAAVDAQNPRIGAVVQRLDERARAKAESTLPAGPFRGVPFLLKDLLADLTGTPTSRGSRFFAGDVAESDVEIVRRYEAAGTVIVGKTNTPEFGLMPTTEPALHGPTRNPWDPTRVAGGSSGGAAAAVASRMVPIAAGGDGGGSLRIPASCCGVFGLKPTRGRTPAGPRDGERWRGFAVEHVITRSVRDSAAMLDAIAGPDLGAPNVAPPPARPFLEEVGAPTGRLRIAFTSRPFLGDRVDPECVIGLEQSAALLRGLGHEVVEAEPELDGPAFARNFLVVICSEVRAAIEAGERRLRRRAGPGDFETATWALGLLGRSLRASDLATALNELQSAARGIGRFFAGVDVLMTPTLAAPPVALGTLLPHGHEERLLKAFGRLRAGGLLRRLGALEEAASKSFRFTPYTPLFNVTGQPAMSVPLHWTAAGLPVGIQFVGRFGDEATLFRLAAQLEEAQPWAGRRPPG
ncbi:MAG: amidase [Nannocystaceae bacterium]